MKIDFSKIKKTVQNNGTKLYGKNSELINNSKYNVIGYLHYLFNGIEDRDIQYLKRELGKKLSLNYTSFLKVHNGISLYSNLFVLFGSGSIEENGIRKVSRDPNNLKSVDIVMENISFRETNELKIGVLDEDNLILKNGNNDVLRVNKSNKIVESWESIESCIEDIIRRVEPHYHEGVCKNPLIIGKLLFNRPIKI